MHERRFSGDLDRLRSPERIARLEVERVVRLALQDATIGTVLDVGAGTGLFSEAFMQAGCSVRGLDVNPQMLARARELVPGATFEMGLAEQLPFRDRSYDLVFFGLLLHETDDLLQALREARRVASVRAAALEWPYHPADFGPPLADRLPPARLEALAGQAGFTAIEYEQLENLVFYRME